MRQLSIINLHTIDYQTAWDFQEKILKKMVDHKISTQTNYPHDTLILCEHPPVYTLGKGGEESNILISEHERLKQNIQFFRSNRGGDVTFHGPGQMVAYPIIDLEAHKPDIGLYIRNLEETIIKTLAHLHITASRIKGETGVWIDVGNKTNERKICAIGVRCSRWITMHGLALNINTNLNYFNQIIPCGIPNKKVTSIQNELQKTIPHDQVITLFIQEFTTLFNLSPSP